MNQYRKKCVESLNSIKKLGYIHGKNNFRKRFFSLMNNAVLKTMESIRNHRDIKLITTKTRRNYLVSELSYNKIFQKIYQQSKSKEIKCSLKGLPIQVYQYWK